MQVRYESSPKEVMQMTTTDLRANFLIEKLFVAGEINFVYSHYDRVIVGGVMPLSEQIILPTYAPLKSDYFLERREMGIINIGGDGEIRADDKVFKLRKLDALYLGLGTKEIIFKSNKANEPAQFYILSAPAHAHHPNKQLLKEQASPTTMGATETANHRTIYKYIHADGLKSCQLVRPPGG